MKEIKITATGFEKIEVTTTEDLLASVLLALKFDGFRVFDIR